MCRNAVVILCAILVFAIAGHGQSAQIEPLHVPAGTIVTFHLQSRLNPGAGNTTDTLPKGTSLRVKVIDAIDSNKERDGHEFRGVVVSNVVSEGETILRQDSEACVLLVLLRSTSHPQGFRYELLVTNVRDHGKSYDLTASLNPSFLDTNQSPKISNEGTGTGAKNAGPITNQLIESTHR